jgi:predicted ATPase
MRNAIGWSYDLLPLDEQALFRRLAVFVGGFTVEAAEAVGGLMTLDLLTVLVDHSLVRCLPPPGEGARMGMHETIREFGLEQLIAQGEEGAARDAHAGYFLQLGAEADRGMRSHAQLEWFACLEADQDNLRAAIAWLARQERIEEALKLATDTMWFHWIRGLYTESRDLLESLLAHPKAAMRTVGRAKALVGVQGSASPLGDPYRAKLAAMEAVSIAREHDDPYTTAFTLLSLGITHMHEGDLDAAVTEIEENLAIGEELNDLWLVGIASGNLSQIAARRGDIEVATAYAKRALQAGRDVGDRHLMAGGHFQLAEVALRQGSPERAEPSLREALGLIRALGDNGNLPYLLVNLARIALHKGDIPAAVAQIEESLEIAQQTGNRRNSRSACWHWRT